MKILIVKTSAIGDVVHTLPALGALRAHWPEAHIAWLVEEAAAEIVRGHRALDRVLVARRKSWIERARRGDVAAVASEARAFIAELRDTRYDLLIDFQSLLKSSIWVALARATRKAGFGRGMAHAEGSWIFLNERVPPVSMETHALERDLLLVEALGVPRPRELRFDFPIDDVSRAEAEALLREGGLGTSEAFVAINPIAKWPTKLWPAGSFAEVADRLLGAGLGVVFTGAPSDRSEIDAIERMMRWRCVPGESGHLGFMRLDGRTGLKTLAAICSRAKAVLATDTGPMHIAAAVGTPVVALFGPTAPWRTGPFGIHHTVLRAGVSCSPCLSRTCRTRDYEPIACMRRIEPAEVADAVIAAVARSAAQSLKVRAAKDR